MNEKIYNPSGLNSHFVGDETFAGYIHKTQQMIANVRPDLPSEQAAWIIEANSPFEWRPVHTNNGKIKNGILLIHGLFDSPYILRDLAKFYLAKRFLVRSILLPGHGTVPGDTLEIKFEEWLKAVHFGVSSLQTEVSNIYISGFSLGGTLAIYEALRNPNIKGLLLFAPALKAKRAFASFWLQWYNLLSYIFPQKKWYKKTPQRAFTKYESFTCNAALQAQYLIKQTQQLLRQQTLNIPLFIVTNSDDETVDSTAVVRFFEQQQNTISRLLIYTNHPLQLNDPRILTRPSAFLKEKILNFSHTCLPVSPDNPYYGKNGSYQDFLHYPNQQAPSVENIHFGAASKENLQKYIIQRLSYNPDFQGMLAILNEFVDSLGNAGSDSDI